MAAPGLCRQSASLLLSERRKRKRKSARSQSGKMTKRRMQQQGEGVEEGYRSREEVKAVMEANGHGAAYEEAIGFLLVRGSSEPLDETFVHPRDYELAHKLMATLLGDEKMAEARGSEEEGEGRDNAKPSTSWLSSSFSSSSSSSGSSKHPKANLAARMQSAIQDHGGLESVANHEGIGGLNGAGFVIACLTNQGPLHHDPRSEAKLLAPLGTDDRVIPGLVTESNDDIDRKLCVGDELRGIVRNVTPFGTFIDIGTSKDALLAPQRDSSRTDPLLFGTVLRVFVETLHKNGNVALSLRRPASSKAENRRRANNEGVRGKGGSVEKAEESDVGRGREKKRRGKGELETYRHPSSMTRAGRSGRRAMERQRKGGRDSSPNHRRDAGGKCPEPGSKRRKQQPRRERMLSGSDNGGNDSQEDSSIAKRNGTSEQPIIVSSSRDSRPNKAGCSNGGIAQLFVGGLPFSYGDVDLYELFQRSGTVYSASVVRDRRTGRSRGHGFVNMASAEAAENAIAALNGHALENSNGLRRTVLRVNHRSAGR
eukprot:jgi/Bigna1/73409/fgenesh1_pg.24_\